MTVRNTFIFDKEQLEKLRDYAYTERITLTEAMRRALAGFLEDKTELLHRPN